MLSFDFEYYKPASIDEAVQLFQSLDRQGKNPSYISGGTELITLGRVNKIVTGAVIDIKAIPECLVLEKQGTQLVFGAAQSLTVVREKQFFPLLSKAIVEIADHTARNKITLGGNICANIIYREAVLPLLLTDSTLAVAGLNGLIQYPINDIFQQTLQLDRGEFLVQVITHKQETELPFVCLKKRRQWDVGYPLLTAAALNKNGQIKLAISGLCSFPFRDKRMEYSLNNRSLSMKARIEEAVSRIPAPVLNDVHGSAEYRVFVLENTLQEILAEWEGAGDA
ncbi:CO or xanthine dehydrogenase, FAD-binding subunit [Evansella caseinilytica]|uniref:CO or xanthine dehydrogenase, FAD-binding subunit n=1 Tax=Evansella caseinilytica TaxID=1503961 RepID=A0A1H3U6Q3_9BACI|nr:FAD binding domain-containing protein [Evansella caseinilytica]SDZ58100.1 CO or xanthine dehydrogenase, FAD-binding subunit [Evansella caseinilytica]